jgi:hypothetical protein
MGQEILIADDKRHVVDSLAHPRKRKDHEVCLTLLPRRRRAATDFMAPPRGAGTGTPRRLGARSTGDVARKARPMPVGATGTAAG